MDELTDYLKHRQYWKGDESQNVAQVMKQAVKYLKNVDRNKQFYLWIDSFDPHEPWDPPSVLDKEPEVPLRPRLQGQGYVPAAFWARSRGHLHRAGAAPHPYADTPRRSPCVDKWLGYLMDRSAGHGVWKRTRSSCWSLDHGEPLGNGEHGHGIMRKCRPLAL